MAWLGAFGERQGREKFKVWGLMFKVFGEMIVAEFKHIDA